MGSMSFSAGRLLCRHVRDFLNQTKFAGAKIEFMESSGWLERTFTIKGADDDLQRIHSSLEKWRKAMEETNVQ